MLYQDHYQSPLGQLTLLSSKTSVLGLWFDQQAHFAAHYHLNDYPTQETVLSQRIKHWLDQYFDDQETSCLQLPLAPAGTAFQQSVFHILQTIPYGQTRSYQQIADQLSTPNHRSSARAVGGAVGHNPISIIIPCHRVIGSHGALTGYAGGIDRKIWLLKHESTTLF